MTKFIIQRVPENVRNVFCVFVLLAILLPTGVRSAQESTLAQYGFEVGEVLHYKVYWGVVPVANSTATSEWIEEEGRRLIRIEFRTISNSFIEKVYPVDDRIEAVIDPETFLPLRFHIRQSEGSYRSDELTEFNHITQQAVLTKTHTDGHITQSEFAIDVDTRDLITFMYFMRTREMKLGSTYTYRVMADQKIYDLTIKVPQKDYVELERYGRIQALRLEPEAAFEGLFVRKGKMTLWISEGEHALLTKVTAKVPVASVKILLDRVESPGELLWQEVDAGLSPARSRTFGRRR